MYLGALTLVALSWSGSSLAQSSSTTGNPICALIARSISSSSAVYYPVSQGPSTSLYEQDIHHWASSSTQRAKCSVEPGTAADVAKILQILGSTRTPFAVKGGGHTSNPGFSSTTGVHIAMTRFSEVTYNEGNQTATLGAGLIWDEVYSVLTPKKVNVLGGRATGIGVAGFILGGGYSWKANQYGLSIDTVVAFELVKPDGTILQVTKDSHPDLFFGLKGGYNNFVSALLNSSTVEMLTCPKGVVTRFTLKTFPQTDVWGGSITFNASYIDRVSAETADFAANVKDPKASILTVYIFVGGQPLVSLLLFYDGPTPPPGIFENFLKIPSIAQDIKTRDFLSLVQTSQSDQSANRRGIFQTVSFTEITPSILQEIVKELVHWGTQLTNTSSTDLLNYDIDPFLPDIFSHNNSASAYPPNRSIAYYPLSIGFSWSDQGRDEVFHSAIRESANRLRAAAVAEGQRLDEVALYPNYAIFDTPLLQIYGNNVPELARLKKLHDPKNVMGLAGGFKF